MKTLLTLLLLISINITYAAQICPPKNINNTPNIRYTNNDNGTITDNKTKLVWKQCSEGQTWVNGSPDSCTGNASVMNWQDALTLAASTTYVNNSNWQLPNIKQLKSIVAYHCYNPSINTSHFPNTPSNHFWSSSPDVSNSTNERAFVVSFQISDDNHDNRNINHRVRLVRPMY